MISNSTTQLLRFTPQWLDAADPACPVYWVRAGSVNDRDTLEAELAGPPFNAGRVWPHDLRAEADAGARALLSGADLDRVLAALANCTNGEGDTADLLLVGELESALADAWPPYADLMRRQAARTQRLPTLAARRFLRGWENVLDGDGQPVPFEAGIDGLVKLETLGKLPAPEMRAAGIHAYNLLYPETHRPLSVPPSKSAAAPATSTSGGTRPTAARGGKSTARSTPKTPR